MKLPRLSFLLTLGGLALFLLPIRGLTTDSPLEAVRSTTNRVVPGPQGSGESRPSPAGEAHQNRSARLCDPCLTDERSPGGPWASTGVTGRKSSARNSSKSLPNWSKSPTGKPLTGRLKNTWIKSSSCTIRRTIDGKFAEVRTRLFVPSQNKHFSINYRLHQVDGQWLIYDVVVENISMVRNFRTQFLSYYRQEFPMKNWCGSFRRSSYKCPPPPPLHRQATPPDTDRRPCVASCAPRTPGFQPCPLRSQPQTLTRCCSTSMGW